MSRWFGIPTMILVFVWGWGAMAQPVYAEVNDSSKASEPRLIENAEWLIRQPDTAFTLQLLTVSSPAQVTEFVAGEPVLPLDRLATFRYQSGDSLLYVLTLGRFDSAEAAYRVRDALAFNGLVADETWVRPLTDVKRSIRTTLQE